VFLCLRFCLFVFFVLLVVASCVWFVFFVVVCFCVFLLVVCFCALAGWVFLGCWFFFACLVGFGWADFVGAGRVCVFGLLVCWVDCRLFSWLLLVRVFLGCLFCVFLLFVRGWFLLVLLGFVLFGFLLVWLFALRLCLLLFWRFVLCPLL